MTDLLRKYEIQNILQENSEEDPFTSERYQQFFNHFPKGTRCILDVGCNTGRGGKRLMELNPAFTLAGLDCVQARLDKLPSCYSQKLYGLSTNIPVDDSYFDVIVAGEFLEHLYPADVDKTICEFQRILKAGGRLLMTTPNPYFIINRIRRRSIYGVSHLTQHYPDVLRFRLLLHGFSRIRILGTGIVSRYLGQKFPILSSYGGFFITADKI